ncbi:flavoprotein [Terrabacter koreensis]
MTERTLYIVTCGAPLASRAVEGVHAATDRGWSPVLVPTDASRAWLDPKSLEGITVLDGQRAPGEAKRAPSPSAIAVVPATFNTLTGWANGRANTLSLVTLCAGLGARVPTVAVPFAKSDLTGHPAWLASLAVLRYAGVTIVDPHDGIVGSVEPVASGTGGEVAGRFKWAWVLDCLDAVLDQG